MLLLDTFLQGDIIDEEKRIRIENAGSGRISQNLGNLATQTHKSLLFRLQTRGHLQDKND
jgi:hypothetical protein